MSIALTNENKLNTIGLSLESRAHGETWDDANYTWDEASGSWGVPSVPIIEETKVNTIALSLEIK